MKTCVVLCLVVLCLVTVDVFGCFADVSGWFMCRWEEEKTIGGKKVDDLACHGL